MTFCIISLPSVTGYIKTLHSISRNSNDLNMSVIIVFIMDDTFIAMGEFEGNQHVQPSVPDGVTVTKLPVWYLLVFFYSRPAVMVQEVRLLFAIKVTREASHWYIITSTLLDITNPYTTHAQVTLRIDKRIIIVALVAIMPSVVCSGTNVIPMAVSIIMTQIAVRSQCWI